VQNLANSWNDAQGPASSTSTYALRSASSLVRSPPVTHLTSSTSAGFYNYSGSSPTGDECELLDTHSHPGYFNSNTAFTCTTPNQIRFQAPQTLFTGFNIYHNPSTNFGGSASFRYASQPYGNIPIPAVNGGYSSGSHTPFEGWSPVSQSMQVPPAIATQAPVPIQCTALGCSATFKREPDRLRHEAAVHGINQLLQLYLCPVNGCSKSQGSGYTRKDKLTEHLWKKHGNLGYVKRV
jgi:hypothetical protein